MTNKLPKNRVVMCLGLVLGLHLALGADSFAQSAFDALALQIPADTVVHRPILLKSSYGLAAPFDHHADIEPPPGFCCKQPKFFVAAAELLSLELIPNYFNHHVADDSTGAIGPDSWEANLVQGFEWDNNAFSTNMIMHPIHGNTFFNAGRSNGYNFWASSLFSATGSMMWEMFGETNSAAINDWIATTLGGITIGETFHRTAKLIRNNEETGAGRSVREFGALFVDPIGSVNRVFTGDAIRVGANPSDRTPEEAFIQVTTGFRQVGQKHILDRQDSHAYVDLIMQYGDWFERFSQPFESFQFATQINTSDKTALGRLSVDGTLWGLKLKNDPKTIHTFTVNQLFLYVNNLAYEVGGQFFGVTLNSHFELSKTFRLITRFQPLFAVMSGVNAEHDDPLGRDYDFGSGGGARAFVTLFVNDYPMVRLAYEGFYTATINGAKGHHVLHTPMAQFRVKIFESLGVGFDYELLQRHSVYDDYPSIHRSYPTFRLNVTFSWLDRLRW